MPTPTQPLPNPAEQLGAVVSQLYELAGNSNVSASQKQQLFLKAHDLRGDLVTLVAMQFTNNSATYQSVMTNLGGVTTALNQAEQNIQNVVAVVSGVDQLAASIDGLLKEAAKAAAAV